MGFMSTVIGDVKKGLEDVEGWFEDAVTFAAKYVLPVASVVIAADPAMPVPVTVAVNGLAALVKGAEQVFPDGNGPAKLGMVEGAIKGVCEATGYDYTKIQPAVTMAVNTTVALANEFKPAPPTATAAASNNPSGVSAN